MRIEFLCVSVLRVASGPRVKLASCKSALNPPVVYSTDRSKAVVPVLVLLFVALWIILRGDLLYVFPCVILFLCFLVLLVLRLPRLGKRELILVLFVRLFDLCLFGFVGFLFLLGSGKGCGLWLWHSLDFALTFLFRCPYEETLHLCLVEMCPEKILISKCPKERFLTLNLISYAMRSITITCLFKYIENFTTKSWKFSDKNSDIFHISA